MSTISDEALLREVVERTVVLAAIPAPLRGEAERAAVVLEWWRADGLDDVHLDEAGSVLARVRRGSSGRGVFLCAHMDTVFGRDVDHRPRRDGELLRGPGVGDNSVAVAALSALRHLLPEAGTHDVWLVATTGEEGLGNLRGAKQLVADHPEMACMVAVEGTYLDRIGLAGQGSVRARIDVDGPGGHSWSDRERDSAVHGAARAIAALDAERPRTPSEWSWHVASISGGGDINVLASHAELAFEIRADDAGVLAEREQTARAVIADAVGERLSWSWTDLGRRPAGSIAEDHPLARAAFDAHEQHGRMAEIHNGGTDANAALGAGIPAITMGVAAGEGIHTLDEWVSTDGIPAGLRVLATAVEAMRELG